MRVCVSMRKLRSCLQALFVCFYILQASANFALTCLAGRRSSDVWMKLPTVACSGVEKWSHLGRVIQLGIPGSIDPTNFVYYLCVLAFVDQLPRADQVRCAVGDFIDRLAAPMPEGQL